MVSRAVSPLNALRPIFSNLEGNLIEVSEVQPRNASVPITVTVSGMTISVT